MELCTPARDTKRRRRGAMADLQPNWQDERYSKSTILQDTSPQNPNNLQPRSIDKIKASWVARHRQGVNLNTRQREAQYDYLEDTQLFVDQAKLLPGMAAKRRETFALFYFQIFGSPPREKWSRCVSFLAQLLKVPDGSRDAIYRVFEDCEHAGAKKELFSSSSNAHNSGRKKLIQHGTPEECMFKCWTVAPTSKRIVEDIFALERVLRLIVDAKGCVVPDEATRNGRRMRKANAPAEVADEDLDAKFWLKKKPRNSQRKSTLQYVLPPVHPDAQCALDHLFGEDYDAIMEVIPGLAASFGV